MTSARGQALKEALLQEQQKEIDQRLGFFQNKIELANEMQRITPTLYDESCNYYVYMQNKGYYKRVDETTILNGIRHKSSENVLNSRERAEILTAIQLTGREQQVKDVPKNWLRFNNAVYDLTTKETFSPTPEYFFTSPIPHNIGKSEETPTIDKLFSSWVANPVTLQELCAYCLVDDYPIHRMFILLGQGGNGKGEFMKFVTRLVGQDNTTSTDLETILKSRFEAVKLYKKKVALIGETNYDKIQSTDKLKKITGQDLLQGEYKNKNPFDFYNTAKVIISTNDLPETNDKTDGWNRRANVIEFRNHFDDKGKSVVDTIPEREYENFIKKCLKLLVDILERGNFTDEGTTQEKAAKYQRLSNPFEHFREKELIDDMNEVTPIWAIKQEYEIFLKANGNRKLCNDREFNHKLKEAGYEIGRYMFGDKKWTAVFGFKLRKGWMLISHNNDFGQEGQEGQALSISSHIGDKVETSCPSCPSCPEPQKTITELIQILNKEKNIFESENGVINTSNITNFSLWFCERNKPVSPGTNNPYNPSGIKGIAAKLFKITPEA